MSTEYRQKLLSQLKGMDKRVEGLRARVERLDGKARVEARKQLQAFSAQRGEALSRLQSWDEVTQGVDKAWYELAGAFDTLSTRYP